MTLKKYNGTLLILSMLILMVLLSISIQLFPKVGAQSSAATSQRHLGFWVDERDIWGGGGLNWTPQQLMNNYFLSPPYPSAMLFATGPSQINGYMLKATTWLPQVAALADSYPNIQIIVMVFINMSDPAQVTELQNFVNALKGHSSIYGFEYEREYFGNTIQENAQFGNIVTAAGFQQVLDPTMINNFPNSPVLDYSTYPYFNGVIPTSLPSGARSIGVGYGETGPPCSGCSNPIWTQTTVTNIVDNSPAAPFTLIYAIKGGMSQPFSHIWSWSTLHDWIWNDPYYQSNYILANGQICGQTASCTTIAYSQTSTSSTTSSSTTTIGSSTKSQSTTSSILSSSDPSCTLSNTNPSVGSWVSVSCYGFAQTSSVEEIVYNNSTNSYAAYLFPGSTSSSGTLSFSMQITSLMVGNNTASFYSPEISNIPISYATFNGGGSSTTTTTTTSSSTSTVAASATSTSSTYSTISSSTTTETAASSSIQSTIYTTSELSSSSSSTSSPTQTHGHNGQGKGQATGQGAGYTNGNQKTSTSTGSTAYSLSDVTAGISSIISPSSIISLFASTGNPSVAYGFVTYEITLIGGLIVLFGSLRRNRKEVRGIHSWRW